MSEMHNAEPEQIRDDTIYQYRLARHKWVVKNEQQGAMRYIDKHDLRVDGEYQRGEIPSKIRNIARSWNWVSAGVIIVASRDDRYFIIDGQQRVAAAKKLSEITLLPCIVHQVSDLPKEAGAFLDTNVNRKPVNALDKHRASVVSGSPESKLVDDLLHEAGFKLGGKTKDSSRIKCVALLTGIVSTQTSKDHLLRIWPLITTLCDGKMMSRALVGGLMYIESHLPSGISLSDRKWSERILSVGSKALEMAAQRASGLYGHGGGKVCASGMLEAINKGLRNKLEINIDQR